MNGNTIHLRVLPSFPLRGDVWIADLSPVRGHEQGGRRPCLVVSWDPFNSGPADLVIILPITTTDRRIRSHIPMDPPEGGLPRRSFILCEQVRSISKERLLDRRGPVSPEIMAQVEEALAVLLDL
ncbi:MAG: type II toxin-antitoxin system PemK/MazF family toxin [Chloroflexi bacterium]|nr:type II toxin-antitoxin system PemK/MazF family toxin [Chloroflexota bacterium]